MDLPKGAFLKRGALVFNISAGERKPFCRSFTLANPLALEVVENLHVLFIEASYRKFAAYQSRGSGQLPAEPPVAGVFFTLRWQFNVSFCLG